MLQSRVLAMRAAPRLAMRHTPALHLVRRRAPHTDGREKRTTAGWGASDQLTRVGVSCFLSLPPSPLPPPPGCQHTVVPRENPAAFVVLGGVALVAVGLNYAYKTLMKGGGPSTGSMPAGYGQTTTTDRRDEK